MKVITKMKKVVKEGGKRMKKRVKKRMKKRVKEGGKRMRKEKRKKLKEEYEKGSGSKNVGGRNSFEMKLGGVEGSKEEAMITDKMFRFSCLFYSFLEGKEGEEGEGGRGGGGRKRGGRWL